MRKENRKRNCNKKIERVAYLKKSICEKLPKLELWPNCKNQIAKKNNYQTQTLKLWKSQLPKLWENQKKKNQNVTKLKKKFKLWQLKNSNCDTTRKSNCEKI